MLVFFRRGTVGLTRQITSKMDVFLGPPAAVEAANSAAAEMFPHEYLGAKKRKCRTCMNEKQVSKLYTVFASLY